MGMWPIRQTRGFHRRVCFGFWVPTVDQTKETSMKKQPHAQQFASDNYAGVCPEAWEAMDACNRGSASAYGNDPWTA